MYRVALFLVALAFASPQASLLCKVWCQPGDAVASSCHHHDRSTSISLQGNDGCPLEPLNMPSFIREDGLRNSGSPDGSHAVEVPPFQSIPPSSELRIVENSDLAHVLERRPLETTLRL